MFPTPRPWKFWENNQTLRDAVKIVVHGGTYQRATRESGVAYQLIRKFYKEHVLKPGLRDFYRQNPSLLDVKEDDKPKEDDVKCTVFTSEQDIVLLKCIQTCESLFYGLANKEIQMLAYQMVVNEDMKIPEGWQNGLASNAWFVAFKKRHRSVLNNIKKPELSIHIHSKKYLKNNCDQNLIWEKKLVNDFYDNIETAFKQYPELLKNNRVFSLDETYVGIHINAGERLQDRDSQLDIITVCCVICADGTSLPPVIVKPYRDNEQSRTNEFVASRGRLTHNLFIEVMQFFVNYSCSSPSNPCILIMDSDICHFSSAALNLANDAGVYIVTLHPHINILLQPLNGEIFNSFYKHYYELFDLWASEQPSPLDVGKIVDEAWAKAAMPENIANAFKKCGISPYDRDLFTDNEYSLCVQQAPTCYECKERNHYKGEVNNDSEVPDEEPSKEVVEGAAGTSSSQDVEALVENQNAEGDSPSANMSKPATTSSQDLDKLKRRLIRSIARLIKEKKTEAEVWTELKKECGTNCKTLWLRMRSLTLKKLKRLLDADDRIEHVPAVARMTLTDWLLYDLVLVHEKIDVINRGSQQDSRVLENLFALVQRFEIEGRQGDDLAEAWTAATVDYNRKGHQCSPMLMQRRWFQVKELTRHKLYKFWFTYRGHEKRLDEAKADPPTPLQRAISLRYPGIITAPFPTWDERIEQKLVIMPEEFEVKMRRKVHMKPTDEAVPDVVIVEKKIDTITIDSDSDFAEEEESMADPETNESQTPIIVQVKTEPPDMENSIDITEHPVQPNKFQLAIERLEYEEDRILSHDNATAVEAASETVMPYITNIQGATSHKEVNVINQHIPSQTAVKERDLEIGDSNSQESILIDDDDDDASLNQTTNERDSYSKSPSENVTNVPRTAANVESYKNNTNVFPVNNRIKATEEIFPIITSVAGGSQVQAKLEISTSYDEDVETVDDTPLNYDDQEDIVTIAPETDKSHIDIAREIVSEANFNDDGIEFADDGIEENDHSEFNESTEGPENQSPDIEETGAPKFDLKLLMAPVVYTTKLDDMTVYKGKSVYEPICRKELVSKIIIESKPISANTVNDKQIKADNHISKAENCQEQIENAQDFDDNLFQNETSNDEDKFIESKKIKVTSSLLKKPKVKSYHPIQLCKNPDFNMRLKRLTMGFFSHERNRMFLRACKPMTVDLSKAFESKLVDGTMYLKPSDTAVVKTEVEDECINELVPATVQPYAGPVKSLVENHDVDIILEQELQKRMLERNKTITLPNISVVRKINQNLLMAQVAPMVAQAETPTNLMTVQDLIETVVEGNNPQPSAPTVISTNMLKVNPNSTNTYPTVSMNMPKVNTSAANLHQMEPMNMPKANNSAANPPINPMNMPKVIQPVMNKEKSKEASMQQKLLSNLNTPVLPMMPTKLSDNTNNEKQKKKKNQAVGKRPSWLTKIGPPHVIPEDTLLTLDTLYKVLSTFDPSSVPYTSKSKNKSTKQQKKQALAAKQAEIEKAEAEITDLTTDNSDNKNVDSTTVDTGNILSLNQNLRPTKREDFCCWAKMKTVKLTADSKIRLAKHKCKVRCRCCCRELLRQAEIESEIKILQKMQSRDRDTYLETIEQVVQQSRDNHSQVTDTSSSAVTKALIQPNTPQEDRQTDTSSSNAVNESVSANPEQHTDLATSAKTIEVTINLEDDDDNGNDAYMIESQPTNYEVIDNHPPKPALRVYSAPPSNEVLKMVKPSQRGRGRPRNLDRPSIERRSNEDGMPSAPFLIPVKSLQQPIVIEPLVTLDQPVKMTFTDTSVSTNINEIKKTPVVKQKRKSREPTMNNHDSGQEKNWSKIACTCRPIVAQDKLSPMLVVDGIGECKRHTSSRVSKETRIYLSRKHLTSVQRPFFVGKDKILLTNIKPPKPQKVVEPVLTSSVTQPQSLPGPVNPSETMMLDLPAGVQVIILPDGNISYVLEPGIKLTSKELEDMKMILQIVQVQVNATGYTLPVYDGPPADVTDDVENSNKTKDQLKEISNINEAVSARENDKLASESMNKDRVTVIDNKKDSQTCESKDGRNDTSKCEDTLNDNVPVEKDLTSSNEETSVMNNIAKKSEDTLNQARENMKEIADVDKNSNDTIKGSNRNLLSDLMEMSGILDDDVNTIQPKKAPVSASIEQTDQTTVADQFTTNDQPRPQSPVHQISAEFNKTTYDLTPIVSFSDLKYACENKGLFFKLDLNTGLIVAINVCIQKTQDSSSKLCTTEVIDLTEEQNESMNEINDTSEHQDSTESFDNQSKAGHVYLMSKKNPTEITTILHKKLELIKKFNTLRALKLSQTQSGRSLLKKNLIRQRKQTFRVKNHKVATTIDMVDSDTPMEEEYLEQSSDDSDDEPLAKVAKKMRDMETNIETNQAESRETLNILDQSKTYESGDVTRGPKEAIGETNEALFEPSGAVDEVGDTKNESGDLMDIDDSIDFEAAIHAVDIPVNTNTERSEVQEPVPTQLMLSGPTVSQPILLNDAFLNEDEDSQDDCILGV